MISPLYSMITSPLGMGARAKTPLPWTPERGTWMRRPWGAAAAGRGVLAARACVIDFFGYIEFVGARAYVRAREARIVLRRAGSPVPKRKFHEQDTGHRREAFRRERHRSRTDLIGRKIRETRRVLRERALHRHVGGGPPGGDQGARGIRREARQVELRAPARH